MSGRPRGPRRSGDTAHRRTIDRLRALRHDPAARAAFAAQALPGERNSEVLLALLGALAGHVVPDAGDGLRAALVYLRADPRRRDPGGFVRAATLRALAPLATGDDLVLFLEATHTYEPSPQDGAAPSVLRAAGLAGLLLLDEREATAAAIRLLADNSRTALMTGEPALTAARALAAAGQVLPLYLFSLLEAGLAEVVAECLRGLAAAPTAVLAHALEHFAQEDREIVLLAVCDLVTTAEAEEPVLEPAARLLSTLASDDLYAYLVAAIVAARRRHLVGVLLNAAEREHRPERLRILADSLVLLPGEEARHVTDTLARRLPPAD
ncbi:MAG: hypothetical protein IT304_02780 [Dehalococcoidia bacterium]|nr:hypothetical protein [Dehalococcoidia bacterium]